ncbi:MAG: glutamine--fructose-6-phosphate transaminase (isomerizing) [Alphaproteobacteria bacterium]|nr:glutamine--fructose-6-phosphate transaminase (isomerizing) [Alphaproteobacteria bacterium]
MCGIVGIVGKSEVTSLLLSGLKRLEYRGYDSAGIAIVENGMIERCRAKGKIVNLENKLNETPLSSHIGIAHTRWATHGVPNETNAHPHATDKVAIVHNGIIENFQELRDELLEQKHEFESDTDTEVIVHLITENLNNGMEPKEATFRSLQRLQGAFALGILFADYPDMLIAARQGSPLAIGYGDGEMYLGSDALALAHLTQKISYLEDGDWAVITQDEVLIYDKDDTNVKRQITTSAASGAIIGKGEYRHFMLKEIYEQPQVIGDTLNGMFNPVTRTISMPEMPFKLKNIDRMTIIACGTSYYAAMTAKYWIEKYAGIIVDVDLASEFRYRKPVMKDGGLALFISQSGETADTLAALKYCKAQNQHTLAIVNVTESTIAREADAILHTLAGPEIGVASTKAFTTQLVTLACLAIAIGKTKGTICHETEEELTLAISELPAHIVEVLNYNEEIKLIAHQISEARDVLYLGRGTSYPIALEGALKLKEISYIHAEGYAAGELKHGPIALIDEEVPIIVVAPSDELFEKTASNVLEVIARGGKVILLSDSEGTKKLVNDKIEYIIMPKVSDFVAPILYSIPVQLLAYHTAVIKGTDVDQPRNLAKSVTVE